MHFDIWSILVPFIIFIIPDTVARASAPSDHERTEVFPEVTAPLHNMSTPKVSSSAKRKWAKNLTPEAITYREKYRRCQRSLRDHVRYQKQKMEKKAKKQQFDSSMSKIYDTLSNSQKSVIDMIMRNARRPGRVSRSQHVILCRHFFYFSHTFKHAFLIHACEAWM